ncbi:hypothetical protein E2C01_088847 [Portunus trituberculatus]|uniref:Uncharacterized protein n=1 Tax=Portunus trituberculatus TaxID=210409 RepID=A0A5B7JKP3_PORTR|nr:hypothetical protein [Portunus trituberculatus]
MSRFLSPHFLFLPTTTTTTTTTTRTLTQVKWTQESSFRR